MSLVGRTILIRGEVTVQDDLVLDGRVEGGPVWCDGHAVTVASTGSIAGDIVARDITAFGTISGTMLASEVVDVRESADVTGRVVSPRIILAEGATFNGRVDHQFESALRVARYRREK